jgi:large subunit ribosomal protein L4
MMSEKIKTTQPVNLEAETVEKAVGSRVLTPNDLSLSDDQKKVVDPRTFAISVRALLQNWRQGTVGAKGRSDVSLTGKKPWRQKGTGRARAGSARSPLWRGGGVCHGPQERTRTLSVPKVFKRNIMNSLLWQYLEQGNVICLQKDLSAEMPKTSLAAKLLADAGLKGKKVNVFVQNNDLLTQASFANLKNVKTMLFDQPNAFDLASGQSWVIFKKDMNAFKEMVSKWL